jgi:hypothetical protein
MPIRDLFWLSAASTTLAALTTCGSISSALAENSCVTSPGLQTEPGAHWYYHVDRATNRQCWYSKRLQRKTSTTGSAVSALSGEKEMAQTLPKREKAAIVPPLDATAREVLFRQFLEWRERQLVGTEFQTFLGHQEEEPFSQ